MYTCFDNDDKHKLKDLASPVFYGQIFIHEAKLGIIGPGWKYITAEPDKIAAEVEGITFAVTRIIKEAGNTFVASFFYAGIFRCCLIISCLFPCRLILEKVSVLFISLYAAKIV
jgi:hypothetical protein